MSAENAAKLRQLLQMFGTGDFTGVEAIISAEIVEHQDVPGIDAGGGGGFQRLVTMLREGFPDLDCRIDELIDGGDKVVALATLTGTNTGSFMGMPPTGRQINAQSIDIVRFENGVVVEHWGITEDLKMLQQLGLMPSQ